MALPCEFESRHPHFLVTIVNCERSVVKSDKFLTPDLSNYWAEEGSRGQGEQRRITNDN